MSSGRRKPTARIYTMKCRMGCERQQRTLPGVAPESVQRKEPSLLSRQLRQRKNFMPFTVPPPIMLAQCFCATAPPQALSVDVSFPPTLVFVCHRGARLVCASTGGVARVVRSPPILPPFFSVRSSNFQVPSRGRRAFCISAFSKLFRSPGSKSLSHEEIS